MTDPTPQVGDVVIFEADDKYPEIRCPIIREERDECADPWHRRKMVLLDVGDLCGPESRLSSLALAGKRFTRNGQEGVYA